MSVSWCQRRAELVYKCVKGNTHWNLSVICLYANLAHMLTQFVCNLLVLFLGNTLIYRILKVAYFIYLFLEYFLGFMMEMTSWGGSEMNTLQFMLPKVISFIFSICHKMLE